MTKTILAILVFTLIGTTALAQRNTYIGVEGAATHDVYDIVDDGPLLQKAPLLSGYFGLSVRQDLSPTVFLETGLLRKYYNEGIDFKPVPGYAETNAINAWLIPLRLGTRINIRRQKVFLVPVVGYAFGINSEYGYGDGGLGGFEATASKDTIHYSMYSNLNVRRTFPLLQTGMGVEFELLRTVLVSVAANYYTGSKNLIEQDIEYTYRSSTYTATGLSKGDMMGFGVAFKYPVSHLWRGKGQ